MLGHGCLPCGQGQAPGDTQGPSQGLGGCPRGRGQRGLRATGALGGGEREARSSVRTPARGSSSLQRSCVDVGHEGDGQAPGPVVLSAAGLGGGRQLKASDPVNTL